MTDTGLQHEPHVGADYAGGIDGRKIAIVGYSHWGLPDRSDFTIDCIERVVAGEWDDISFFNQIASYFGKDHGDLWRHVIFLNFLPRSIGADADRYAWGSEADAQEGRARVMSVLERYHPDMLFVFSRKTWRCLPPTLEDDREQGGRPLLEGQPFDRHHYRLRDGHVVQAFALRHPQFASKSVMTNAVAAALMMQPEPPA